MASFEIRWRSSTKKDLRSLPREEVSRIIDAVAQRAEELLPPGSQKLPVPIALIAGDYRVVYEVLRHAATVEIQRVRHRKDVYR